MDAEQAVFDDIVAPLRYVQAATAFDLLAEFLWADYWPLAVSRWREFHERWRLLDGMHRRELRRHALATIETRDDVPFAQQKLEAVLTLER